MNTINMKGPVIQRIISEYSYNVMMICKRKGINELQEYIKEEYGNYSFLSYPDLYSNLLIVIDEVCTDKQIKDILTRDIKDTFRMKSIRNNCKPVTLNYEDLCNMLITKIDLLNIKTEIEKEDLFLIDVKGQIMSMDEYNEIAKRVRKPEEKK